MFINKLDRPGSSFTSSLQSLLRHRLHPRPMVLNLPIASFDAEDYTRGEPGIQGLVDLIKWEVWKWDSNHNCSKHRLPRDVNLLNSTNIFPENHPLLVHLLPARHALLDNLSMTSDDFMNTMLDLPSDDPSAYLSLHADQIIPHLRNASLKNEALPVICGAAAKSIGTELLMNYIGELLPSPADLSHDEQDNKSILRVLAWKVGWDAKLGWLTFVRVYSGETCTSLAQTKSLTSCTGTLTKNAQLFNVTRKTKEQVGRLMLFYASEHRTVNSLSFGSVGVITGLKYTRTGDTLTAASAFASSFKLGDITAPPTLMSASVIPRSHSDLVRAEEALGALIRTDPSVRVENTEGQLIIHGVGALHLEIVAGRLKDEWGVNFELGVPRVSFREGAPPEVPMTPYTWKTDVAGVQVEIRISLAIRPLLPDEHGDPAWAGNVVTDANGIALPSPESTSSEELTLLARGIWSSLSNSPTTSLSMTGIHITLGECKWPSLPNPAVLSGAGAAALRECLQSVPMGPIMEPYVRLKVVVNEDNLGKVMRDLTDTASGEVIDLTTGQSIQSIGDEEHMPFTEDGVYIPPDVLSPSSVFRSGQPDSSIQGIKRTIHAIAPLSKMSDYASRLRSLSSGYGSFEMTSAGFRRVSESRKIDILAEIGYESRRARIL